MFPRRLVLLRIGRVVRAAQHDQRAVGRDARLGDMLALLVERRLRLAYLDGDIDIARDLGPDPDDVTRGCDAIVAGLGGPRVGEIAFGVGDGDVDLTMISEQLHTGSVSRQASENHTQVPTSSQSASFAASKDAPAQVATIDTRRSAGRGCPDSRFHVDLKGREDGFDQTRPELDSKLVPVDMRFGYERLGGLVRERMHAPRPTLILSQRRARRLVQTH